MNNINYIPELIKTGEADNYIVKLSNSAGGTTSLGRVTKSEIRSDREGTAVRLALKMTLSSEESKGIEKFLSAVQSISKELSRY